jgi:hypothetical protein
MGRIGGIHDGVSKTGDERASTSRGSRLLLYFTYDGMREEDDNTPTSMRNEILLTALTERAVVKGSSIRQMDVLGGYRRRELTARSDRESRRWASEELSHCRRSWET